MFLGDIILASLNYTKNIKSHMDDFEVLMSKLLESNSNLTRDDILHQIEIKKRHIGAGYLTDQGALFLVASDAGVQLSEPLDSQMKLKDIYSGAKDIQVEVRVMGVSKTRNLTRKDNSPLALRTMTVYDENTRCPVKMWDAVASLAVLDGLKPGDAIRISGGYVRSDNNGGLNINLGDGGQIETVDDLPDIPGIDDMAVDPIDITEADRDAIVAGELDGMVSTMNFTNSRGMPSTALRMRIRGENGTSYRVVLWGLDDSAMPKMIKPKAKVKLLGVRGKQGQQDLEIHGNDSTQILVDGDLKDPLTLRIISISANERSNNLLLCVDSAKTLYFLMDQANHSIKCRENDVIECQPTKAYGKSITLEEDAYIRNMEDDFSIPTKEAIRTRIGDAEPGDDYCIEVIVLQNPVVRDVQTRSGESIQLLEMYVGDDSKEMWVKGWRNQALLAADFKQGDRLSITGINARHGMDGRVDLVLTAFSVITAATDPKTL